MHYCSTSELIINAMFPDCEQTPIVETLNRVAVPRGSFDAALDGYCGANAGERFRDFQCLTPVPIAGILSS
jgi:hypothetical protein